MGGGDVASRLAENSFKAYLAETKIDEQSYARGSSRGSQGGAVRAGDGWCQSDGDHVYVNKHLQATKFWGSTVAKLRVW